MRSFISYVRILIILIIVYALSEWLIDFPTYKSVLFNPYFLGFEFLIFILLLAFESTLGVLNRIADQLITEEKKLELEAQKKRDKENRWLKKIYRYLVGSNEGVDPSLGMETHEYDGIKEFNNPLPPWWVYLFYITIVFAIVYLGYYHVFNGTNQIDEYLADKAQADIELEEYKKTAIDFVDAKTVVLLTDENSLEQGKVTYNNLCAVCHRPDGGGSIGPNLTDAYWILGGDIQSVFKTIAAGGRPGKGMIAWNTSLRPSEIQRVGSYILSLQGTSPENPKAPEGTLIQ